jgi:hypothetical protein
MTAIAGVGQVNAVALKQRAFRIPSDRTLPPHRTAWRRSARAAERVAST